MEFLTNGLHECNRVVVTAATESGEREQGDAWRLREELLGGSVGLMDDFDELVFGGVLAGGHVGEKIEVAVALHDGETREGLAGETKMLLAGEDDIARGVIDAGNHGVGLARFDHGASGGEIGSFESSDF